MSEDDHNFIDSSVESSVGIFNTVKNFVYDKKQSLANYMEEKKVSETTSFYYEATKDKMYHLFTDHPRSKNMTYWQHLYGSMIYFVYSFGATLSFLFHGLFPFMLETRGSRLTSMLYEKLGKEGIIETKSSEIEESEPPKDEQENEGDENVGEENDGEENDGEENNIE